jgi:twitching motility protein PilT
MVKDGLTIHRLMGAMKGMDASDLHIKVGYPPTYRIGGLLRPVDCPPLEGDETDRLMEPLLTPKQKETFEENGGLDFAAYLPDGDRFRIDLFRSGGHTHAAFRRVKAEIPTYSQLHLPPIYSKLIETTNEGLLLIVGVTGCGKSTTIAAMIEHINAIRPCNIITIEDPIEYRFSVNKAVISQREIGIDVSDFHIALKHMVRQDPDVVFIGELRDHDTVLAAIQAAETGHLVFGTLHTADTMQCVQPDAWSSSPRTEHDFVRSALSNSLKAICAQRLMPALETFETSVVPATEVLIASPSVREKIREGYDEDLPAIINTSSGDGMHSFTQSLARLVNAEAVGKAVAMSYAPNREALDSALKGVEVKAQSLVSRVRGKG